MHIKWCDSHSTRKYWHSLPGNKNICLANKFSNIFSVLTDYNISKFQISYLQNNCWRSLTHISEALRQNMERLILLNKDGCCTTIMQFYEKNYEFAWFSSPELVLCNDLWWHQLEADHHLKYSVACKPNKYRFSTCL